MRDRKMFFYMLVLVVIPCFALADIKMKPYPWAKLTLGNPKVADGSMNEWSGLGGVGGHGSVDNEWYIYETGHDFWNDPQGGELDNPLSILVMVDNPSGMGPDPVASGLNLWGIYLCYEPHRSDGSVTAALDLPLSSNPNVSPDYKHPYDNLAPLHKFFYPVAFDADGNGDPQTVNSEDYYPASSNGFNFILSGGLVLDDRDEEEYRVTFFLGDDNFPSTISNTPGPGGTDGLIIQVELESEYGVIKPAMITIPGSQTKSGMDLDLLATYGSAVFDMGGHDHPDPHGNPRIVDIEVKINMLFTIVQDPTYIDWTKVGVGMLTMDDLRKIYVSVRSGSLDDVSAEHLVRGGHVFPALPMEATK